VFDVVVAGLSARKGKRPQRGRLGGQKWGGVLATPYPGMLTLLQTEKSD